MNKELETRIVVPKWWREELKKHKLGGETYRELFDRLILPVILTRTKGVNYDRSPD